ncbi:hypothetical protein EI555_016125 [Monodon monoceros]|uniref:RNA-binding protein 44 n=1 Tax=Monodon monoceros TaxID=40151 RepID=A0A4U1EXJ5_MONMO|nr:hypothetical protein EI555_016125 [Monodon monoceros]
MQATEVVETASGKGYHSNGNIQKDEPSNRRKENLLSPNGCKEAKLTFLDYDWDSLALEKRASDKEISNIDKLELLEPSFPVSPNTKMESAHSQSSELEGRIDSAFLNETYSTHHSGPKLKSASLIHSHSEFGYEMQKRKEVFFDILHRQGDTTVGLERIYQISDDDSEDVQKRDLDDDSQQEYHSAEEQEYINNHLSFDQTKTLNISNLEVWGLRSSGYGVNCASNLEDNHVKLESNSSTSLDSADVYGQEGSPHVSKFQNSVMLREYHEPKHGKCMEQDTSLMYHTVFDAIVLKGSPLEHQESQSKSGFLNPQKALKTKIYTGKVKSQVTKSKDFCGNSVVEKKMLQHLENPSTLPQDKVLETLLQPYKDRQSSWTSIFDDSVISACYKSLENTPNPALDFSVTLPRSAIRDNQAIEEGSSLRAANGSTTNKACFHHMEGPCPESVTDVASCTVTVNQTVDVSTDFRACFTTSRATSTRSSVVCTSSNTEITMRNKKWPDEWQSEKRSVACNTDWAYSQDNEDPQVAVTKGPLGKSVSIDSLKPKGNFLNKDSLELRKTFDFTDLKKHSERNLSSNSTKKELGSALLTVLEDLKVRYVNLKEKINKGIPLEELPPLSVESKLLSTFSAFASRLMKEESHIFSGADSELDNQSTRDVDGSSSLKKTLSQMSLLPDNSHPKQDTSPKEDGLKNGDVDIDFSQLKLDDKDSTNYREISEDWFDAKENVTGADFSGIQENQTVQDKEDPKFTLAEMKNVEPLRRDKGYLIHVGGLCPSVSEADLRSHFQKYEISDISIYDSSPNYRYASLALKKNNDAKLAVKEMNGTEINGKSVNVRLVKTPGEYTSPLSSKSGNKVSFSNLEKNISKEVNSASSVSRLPRTRPRQQLGSEQDSEFFAFDQKVSFLDQALKWSSYIHYTAISSFVGQITPGQQS